MTTSTFSPADAAVRRLRSSMRGTVLGDSDASYDQARLIWNGAVERRPAVIARCAGEDDVLRAVAAAREHDLALSVRGGGHDWAGRALNDGGLVLDLSAMRGVTVDPDAGVAVAQGGATAGDVVAAAGRYGLTPVTGTVKAVGMAGLTLAGGYGPLNGKQGLALDNLLEAKVALADGRTVIASDTEDADLYWALRGGGGSLGVATAMRYRLHRLESVLAGLLLFPIEQAATVLQGYRELIAEAPDELTVMAGFLAGPDGQPLLFLSPTWSGEPEPGKRAIARLEQLGTPALAQIAAMPYTAALGLFDQHVVNGRHSAMRTRWLAQLDQHTAATLIAAASSATSPHSALAIHHFHGAATRVPTTATAFAQRDEHLLVEILAAWEPQPSDGAGTHRRWADALSDELADAALPGGYPNLLAPDEPQRVQLAYGPNAKRLLDIRRRYDPDGIFSSATGSFAHGAGTT